MSDKIKEFRKRHDEVKKLEAELRMKEGQLNDEMTKWLKTFGLPEQFTLIDVLEKIYKQ